MNIKLPEYVLYPILGSIGGTLLFVIPVIGPLLFLPLIAFSELYDLIIPGDFSKTGEHVEVWFAGIGLKTIWAWLFYASFFFIIGLIVGLLKHLTKGKLSHFFLSLLLLAFLVHSLAGYLEQSESKQELIKYTTPTETVFVCNEFSSLNVDEDGTVWKFEDDGVFRTDSREGSIDFTSNTFLSVDLFYDKNEHTIKLLEQLKKDLDFCLNINGESIGDLYTIKISDRFFQESI
jgi:hypothetical protein